MNINFLVDGEVSNESATHFLSMLFLSQEEVYLFYNPSLKSATNEICVN